MQRGVTIVDREHTELREGELQLQMSGGVNDDDILRAGRQAGANKIIIVAITGAGHMARLQFRILDVERGVPLFQSNTDDNWRL
jgi:predicted nucleotidyltransferase